MDFATTTQGFSYLQKELELKQNLVGEGFARPPQEGKIRINVIGELTRAERFEADQIYLNYEIVKPPFWQFDNEEEDYSFEPPELQIELNRQSSVTNIAKPNTIYDAGEAFSVYHFSFPLDWQFMVDEDLLMQKWPIIIVQVNSLDSWGRYRIEGYGFTELPRYSGTHEIEVKTWRPYANQESQTFSYFLGGSIGVKDPKSIAKTSHRLDYDEDAIVNRFGTTSETAGTVHFSLNVIKQSENFMQENRKEFRDVKYKERLEGLKQQKDEMYQTGNMGQSEAVAPSLMRTDHGLISRFS